MLTTLANTTRGRSRRRKVAPPPPGKPILIIQADIAGTVLTLHFDQTVSLNGLPQIRADEIDASPVSATQTFARVIAITFDNSIEGAAALNVVFQDPAIRNASGGYVTSNLFPV